MYILVYKLRGTRNKNNMPNRKKQRFSQAKMLSSRVENTDYLQLETLLEKQNLSVQQFVNSVVRSYISGTIAYSGSLFYNK